jgi:hypothetical protein
LPAGQKSQKPGKADGKQEQGTIQEPWGQEANHGVGEKSHRCWHCRVMTSERWEEEEITVEALSILPVPPQIIHRWAKNNGDDGR